MYQSDKVYLQDSDNRGIKSAAEGMYRSVFNQLEAIRNAQLDASSKLSKEELIKFLNCVEALNDLLCGYEDEPFLKQYHGNEKETGIAAELENFEDDAANQFLRKKCYRKVRRYYRALIRLMRRHGLGFPEEMEDIIDVRAALDEEKHNRESHLEENTRTE